MKWILLLLIPIIIYFNIRIKKYLRIKKEKEARKNKEINLEKEKRQVLHSLNELLTPHTEAYKGKTEKEFNKLNNTIEEVIENYMTDWEETNNLEEMKITLLELKEEKKSFMETMKKKIKEWETLEKNYVEVVSKGENILNSTNFYPTDFVFVLNKVKGDLMELKEERRENPLSTLETYETKLSETKNLLEQFEKLHTEISNMIEEVEKKKESLKKENLEEIIELKQEVFTNLQKTEFEEAKEGLEKINKIIK